jgi:hypothetical protein
MGSSNSGDKDYEAGRADAANNRNDPPRPDIFSNQKQMDQMPVRQARYKEGQADKRREMEKD